MRKLEVFRNGVPAGLLTEISRHSYIFRYHDTYFRDSSQPPISITLPKSQQEYQSDHLFPYFSNMVAEGANLAIQSRYLNIDEQDTLSLLAATAHTDTIGAVTVRLPKDK